MITKQNLHMHSTFDDGADSCLDMLLACRQAGIVSAGVSLHSPMRFETDWTAKRDGVDAFLRQMEALKSDLSGTLQVFTGIEWDVLSPKEILDSFDYVIGSGHFLPVSDVPPSVDNVPEETENLIGMYFGGDADAAAERYFAELFHVAEEKRVQICGHFDLLTKFNERFSFFNPESERYIKAGQRALTAILDAGKVIEVNTGAISRGWRTNPYPDRRWLLEIARRHGRVMLSSDAHACANVVTAFEETEALLRSCGFKEIVQYMGNGEFERVPL